jgi:hypothetical protein
MAAKILHEVIKDCFGCPYAVNEDGYEDSWCSHDKSSGDTFPKLVFLLPKGWIEPGCPLPDAEE